MPNFKILIICLLVMLGAATAIRFLTNKEKYATMSKAIAIILAAIAIYYHYRCMAMGDYHAFSEKFARWFVYVVQSVNRVVPLTKRNMSIGIAIIAIIIFIIRTMRTKSHKFLKSILLATMFSPLATLAQQNEVTSLPNPLKWASKAGEVTNIAEWNERRAEIASLIQNYEIGQIPEVSRNQITPRMSGDTLFVTITVGKESLTLSSVIRYPETGTAPYPLLIGSSRISLPDTLLKVRPIARMNYNERQVNGYSQFRGDTCRANYGFVRLYPHLIDNGAYSEWAWGFQRIIDGLEILGPEVTKIDTRHIGVTGCSYAGKMALFCGAFDPRVALTIAQEPGGGGAAAWRVSHTLTDVEDLDRTDYHWFKHSLREQFHGDSVFNLPYDHHELCALVCPRAFLMLGNTDYKWLADESGYVSVNAARRVWEHLGISDRMGYSILGNHPHCMLPEEQYKEVEAFIDRFLLGKDADTNDIRIAPMFKDTVDLSTWIKF